ncbi:MAG: hypothetical protein FD180_188 [Planctomycetota bacterium]|nr:MAG: hypothetical protein FD180_188 [Planctomycetota bacterium]
MVGKSTLLFFSTLVCLTGCGKSEDSGSGGSSGGGGSSPPPLYAQNDSADNLKGLLDTIMKSSEAGEHKKAATLIRALLPDKAGLAKALKDDAPAAFIDECVKQNQSIPADDAQVSGLFKRGGPDRTQIEAHGATTEEIAAYKDGSVPFKEFPGGAKKLAEQVLRAGVKFYEVEFVAPGEDSGMKFHMFYYDGSGWRMLGPAWRALK